MKLPGPDHPIAIVPNKNRVRVIFDGKVIADTTNALTLTEASYKPVQYIPRGDVDMAQLVPTRHATHCPYKGDASYFTITGSNGKGENAVWSYETPFSAVAPITGHLAFYRNRVDAIEEMPS
jgi:uncharacterized protein (DUF427 family)